ncbi:MULTISPECIES: hypothetical protein [unclassified Streptomyces]|uniref:hypothetical protein n=1 Tax=unclassified Streptomyces TaxID=2593676 RepID=UPI002E27C796|nr:hypothetical protein [Streptomyces sp. NBC_00223]
MLGDEAQPDGSEGSRKRAAAGPRHAAPRKSLLTKLHVPAGKAVALAAMPTAVLMGMGFTPHLAQADELPDNPFKPGPCVTRSDTPSPSATAGGQHGGSAGTPTSTPTDRATDRPTTTPSPSATSDGQPDPVADPTATGSKPADDPLGGLLPKSATAKTVATKAVKSKAGTAKSAKSAGGTPQATTPVTAPAADAPAAATSAGAKKVNPLDPLGLGDLLNGLLGGGKKPGGPTTAPTTQPPEPAPTTQAPEPTGTATEAPPKSSSGGGSSGGTSGGTSQDGGTSGGTSQDGGTSGGSSAGGSSGGSSGGSTSATPSRGPKAKETAGVDQDTVDKVTKALQDAGVASPSATAPADSDGKQPYPCPTYDAQALADAKTEPGIPLLPDAPWTLKSSMLTLYGLDYDGIVKVRTWSGGVKDVLKFTATGVDIADLHQIVDGPGDGHTHVRARKGSTSTIRHGTVTMYTESLSGDLLGLIPVTFTPKAPPPLTLPVLFFTDVTVLQAGQFGGTLTIPGMSLRPGTS